MSDNILVEIWKEHLPYEIGQMRGTFQLLCEMESKGSVLDGPRKIVKNSLIEAFCVHTRSLLDFFAEYKPRSSDAIASEFSTFRSSLNSCEVETLRTKLNKEIFHLTKDRTTTDKFDVRSDGKTLMRMIEAQLEGFVAARHPQFPPFQCDVPKVPDELGLKVSTCTASFAGSVWNMTGWTK